MLERDIENKLIRPVKDMGGWCLKCELPGFTGMPDRIIFLPGPHVVFAETKRPGKKERARQEYVQAQLRGMGFKVFSTVDSFAKIAEIIEYCRRLVYAERI